MEKKQLTTYNQYIKRKWAVLMSMLALMLLSAVLSMTAGSADLGVGDILRTLFGGGSRQENAIIWNVRMPRVATAVVVGMALALSGCRMCCATRWHRHPLWVCPRAHPSVRRWPSCILGQAFRSMQEAPLPL